MNDMRSEAEKFVSEFLDYVEEYDILDYYNKQRQKMQRSAGIETLIKRAKTVFPERKPDGESAKLMAELNQEERDKAIEASSVVIDTREMFSRRVAKNGGVRRMLREVIQGNPIALAEAMEFFAAEDGEKEFHVPSKV
jgi:hypothetical protein